MVQRLASEAEEVESEEYRHSTFVQLLTPNHQPAESTASRIVEVAALVVLKKFCGDPIAVAVVVVAVVVAEFDVVAVVATVAEAEVGLMVAAVVAVVELELVVVAAAAAVVAEALVVVAAVDFPKDSWEILRSDYQLPDFVGTFYAPELSPRPPWS